MQEDRTHWEIVFFTAAGAYVIGSLLFCLMGSGEEQPWSRIESEKGLPQKIESSIHTNKKD